MMTRISRYDLVEIKNPSWLEITSAVASAIWLLVMNNHWIKWNHGVLNLFGTIVIFVVLIRISRFREHPLTPWFGPLFGMLVWSVWRFINWALNDRAMSGLINSLSTSLNSLLPRGTLTVSLIITGVLVTYWVYKLFKVQKPQRSWVLLVILAIMVLLTTTYLGLERIQENCQGINFTMFYLPCNFRPNLGFSGYVWFVLLLFLIPTAIALRGLKEYGFQNSLIIISFIPVWAEILFYPFQIFGFQALNDIRSPGPCLTCQVLLEGVQASTYVPILGFIVLIPVGLAVIHSEKSRKWWVASVSLITLIILYFVVLRSLLLLESIVNSLPLDWIMFGVLITELWLPLLFVIWMVPHEL